MIPTSIFKPCVYCTVGGVGAERLPDPAGLLNLTLLLNHLLVVGGGGAECVPEHNGVLHIPLYLILISV
jgi:hypothetical protein